MNAIVSTLDDVEAPLQTELEKVAPWLGLESIELVRERSLSPAHKDRVVVEPASLRP